MNRIISTTAVALTFILAQPVIANAAEIKVWTARAIATVLAEVGPQFERTTGHKLTISTDLSSAFVRRANAGEPFDIMITGAPPLDGLIKDGKIIVKTRTSIARSGIGVEVRAGAPKPDISSVEAFKRHGRHHSDSDDPRRRPRRPTPAGDTVLRRVYFGRQRELKSARRGQAIDKISYRADGHTCDQGTGHGAGALTAPCSRPPQACCVRKTTGRPRRLLMAIVRTRV